jgi:hypothetical protein
VKNINRVSSERRNELEIMAARGMEREAYSKVSTPLGLFYLL